MLFHHLYFEIKSTNKLTRLRQVDIGALSRKQSRMY